MYDQLENTTATDLQSQSQSQSQSHLHEQQAAGSESHGLLEPNEQTAHTSEQDFEPEPEPKRQQSTGGAPVAVAAAPVAAAAVENAEEEVPSPMLPLISCSRFCVCFGFLLSRICRRFCS